MTGKKIVRVTLNFDYERPIGTATFDSETGVIEMDIVDQEVIRLLGLDVRAFSLGIGYMAEPPAVPLDLDLSSRDTSNDPPWKWQPPEDRSFLQEYEGTFPEPEHPDWCAYASPEHDGDCSIIKQREDSPFRDHAQRLIDESKQNPFMPDLPELPHEITLAPDETEKPEKEDQ